MSLDVRRKCAEVCGNLCKNQRNSKKCLNECSADFQCFLGKCKLPWNIKQLCNASLW